MSKKVLWFVIVLLLAVIVGFAAKFMVLGSTQEGTAEDSRTVVVLNSVERAAVLSEMRALLEATQLVVEGLTERDMKQVAEAASAVGMQATSTMDVRLMAKLPLNFKRLGMSTHKAFDEIAALAQTGDASKVQRKLAETMNNCVACHASFQIPSVFQ
ncbi:cytochrome c [Ghiorsea bivora]|uniref:cytochrome c n=1 Tax=Ghiorsea bivora TaxID=1485545 RepID=UPI00056EEABC|nr:cytochrome c [Ghiorsea bivora]